MASSGAIAALLSGLLQRSDGLFECTNGIVAMPGSGSNTNSSSSSSALDLGNSTSSFLVHWRWLHKAARAFAAAVEQLQLADYEGISGSTSSGGGGGGGG